MRREYLKLAINIPSVVWVFARWFSVAWIESYISPVLQAIAGWAGVPMIAIEGFLIGGIFVGSIWWLVSSLRGSTAQSLPTAVDPLADVKADLVSLKASELQIAVAKSKQTCSPAIVARTSDDFTALFAADNKISFTTSLLKAVLQRGNADPLIEFFGKFADLLDNCGYGLKAETMGDSQYLAVKTKLTHDRHRLRLDKKQRDIISRNIDRITTLMYGVPAKRVVECIEAELGMI